MSAATEEPVPVNGKVVLGTRRLVVSHVENASSFYAYQEADASYREVIADACQEHSVDLTPLKNPPKMRQVG